MALSQGIDCRHGLHPEAQKSTITTRPRCCARSSGCDAEEVAPNAVPIRAAQSHSAATCRIRGGGQVLLREVVTGCTKLPLPEFCNGGLDDGPRHTPSPDRRFPEKTAAF